MSFFKIQQLNCDKNLGNFYLFKRGASEAAAGRFASVAAKLVKTATQIPIYIRVK